MNSKLPKKQLTPEVNFDKNPNLISQSYDNIDVGKYYYVYETNLGDKLYGKIIKKIEKEENSDEFSFSGKHYEFKPMTCALGNKWRKCIDYPPHLIIPAADMADGIIKVYTEKQLKSSGGKRKTRRVIKSKRHTRKSKRHTRKH
jgi:hypothetical protein